MLCWGESTRSFAEWILCRCTTTKRVFVLCCGQRCTSPAAVLWGAAAPPWTRGGYFLHSVLLQVIRHVDHSRGIQNPDCGGAYCEHDCEARYQAEVEGRLMAAAGDGGLEDGVDAVRQGQADHRVARGTGS